MLCEKHEYYVKICDKREPSAFIVPIEERNTRHIATMLRLINRIGYPTVLILFFCNKLCGLLDYQPQKDVLCEKQEYYVKICDYREPSFFIIPIEQRNTRHIATMLRRINKVGYPTVLNRHLHPLQDAVEKLPNRL